jgi:predicted site-specific integrase-resolvase
MMPENPAVRPIRWLGLSEVSTCLGISAYTANRFARLGRFGEAIRISNRLKVTEAGVEKFCAERAVASVTRAAR